MGGGAQILGTRKLMEGGNVATNGSGITHFAEGEPNRWTGEMPH
jgi:hypothetical protein